jgi:hypothetical protein
VALFTALLGLGCDFGVQQRSATRTLSGVTTSQVAAAAQGVLVDQGFDLAAVSTSSGFVKTTWREGPRQQVMFVVATEQISDEEGNELQGVKTVSVKGFARDRLVGGWSEEYQTDYRIDEMLDAVSDRLTDPSVKPVRTRRAAPAKAECASTPDCPDGKHCAGKKCVSECSEDSDCASGERCDDRGRCVIPPSEPEPCPEPPAPEEEEDEGDDDEDEEEEVTP